MKLLILTAWYYPFIHPRAYRWTVLAEHWALSGASVHVLTARSGELKKEANLNGVHVHRTGFDSLKEWVYYLMGIHHGRGRVGVAPKYPGKWIRLLEWMYKVVWKKLFFPDDACLWYFPARRKLFQLIETEQFDGLITVSLPFTGHLLGLAVKRRFPDLLWVVDIGDPFSVQGKPPNNSFLFQRLNLRLERQVLITADAVSVTTDATIRLYRHLFGAAVVQKMAVIPPLFNTQTVEENRSKTSPILRNTHRPNVLLLGYFGALYSPTRTPDAFLELLTQTFLLRPDLSKKLEVHFFGDIFPEFFQKLAAHPAITLHGLCSRAASWEAMQAMDMLVNIGNTTDFQLPSKAVDYLASGKPVVHLTYVEDDPFVRFFEGNSMFFSLKVQQGRVADTNLLPWIVWLESVKPVPSAAVLHDRLVPFQIEAISNQYLRLFQSKGHE